MINMLCDEMVILCNKFSFLEQFVQKNVLLSLGPGKLCVQLSYFQTKNGR